MTARVDTPPKPPFALTIGVVGHRPNRLPETARATVETELDRLLDGLKQAADVTFARHAGVFSDRPPTLTMISALAEGADRMAAHAALRHGLKLAAALPFPANDYERDFEDADSQADFADLLGKAAAALVLPGDYDTEPRDYESVGLVILDNADLIVAIWDGGPSGGRGGTTELIERAATMGLPVAHIDATGANPTQLLWPDLADHPLTGGSLADTPARPVGDVLAMVVDAITRPPIDADERAKLEGRRR
ncbi:hypothetical protein [Bauldia sp.]|uniref:hypothetical protein n=1 Tax=Bauldia sp. TaxID=2575872 RepID=UPI003BAD7069